LVPGLPPMSALRVVQLTDDDYKPSHEAQLRNALLRAENAEGFLREQRQDRETWAANVEASALKLANERIAQAVAAAIPANSDWSEIPSTNRNRVQCADVFAGALVPREWRIKGVQPLGAELCMLYGDSGSGKSFLIDDMAAHIHLGRPWNGRAVTQGRVIKLCAEGAHDHHYRLHAQAAAFGVSIGELPAVIDNAPDLFDHKQALDVAQQIKAAGGCDVLIIDVLSATFSGDENGSDMGKYIRHVKLMQRSLGCTVWMVHHSGHANKDRARGWSGTRAAVDVELAVAREGELRSVQVSKSKASSDGAKFGFKLVPVVLGRDRDGDEYGSCRVEYTDDVPTGARKPLGGSQKLAFDALQKLGPMNERVEIAEVINAALIKKGKDTGAQTKDDRNNMKRALNTLQDNGRCVIDGEYVSLSGVVKGKPDDAF
jgi:hypothetical protein